jgi:hypothetical protein
MSTRETFRDILSSRIVFKGKRGVSPPKAKSRFSAWISTWD